MTRINLVDPRELSDQHLVAEYREIFMIGPALRRSMRGRAWSDLSAPTNFTLNRGHVKFFYDKGLYLQKRYAKLVYEMRLRGFKPNMNRTFRQEEWPTERFRDWSPSTRDLRIIRQRLEEKIRAKPEFYRWTTPETLQRTEKRAVDGETTSAYGALDDERAHLNRYTSRPSKRLPRSPHTAS